MKVAVVGGGIAGLAIARDLVLRGFEVTLIDKQKIGLGTTTQCAGMLHSGARYATKDHKTANLCRQENKITKAILPHVVGTNNALFVLFNNDNKEYEKKFIDGCSKLKIPIEKISGREARKLEPQLNESISHAYVTPDVVIDTYKLISSYLDDIRKRGVLIYENSPINKASYKNSFWKLNIAGKSYKFDFVVNSTGDGLAEVTDLFGAKIRLSYIYGSMAAFENRLCKRIITRCAPNKVGDVIVPMHKYTLIGSTWHERKERSSVKITPKDEQGIRQTATKMLSRVKTAKFALSLTSVRTHLSDDSYSLSFGTNRDYLILDHEKSDNLPQFISVLPGKLTIARYVAEEVVDLISEKLSIKNTCTTHKTKIAEPDQVITTEFKFYLG